MRDLTVVLDTIIKLIPNVVAGEEPENRQALVKRLEKIKSDAVYIAPENPIGFEKTAEALGSHLGNIDKKYKEIIAQYFSDKITAQQAFGAYNQFYQ